MRILHRLSIAFVLLLFASLSPRLSAQALPDDWATEAVYLTNPPVHGTFYMLTQHPPRPYPFDPSFGVLPVNSYRGIYVVDDSEVDLMNARSLLAGAPFPGGGGGGGGGSLATNFVCSGPTNFSLSYHATNALWLGLTVFTANTASLVIHTADTNAVYDVFGSTNLAELALPALSRTNWTWLRRATWVSTNFNWLKCSDDQAWFQLGTMWDTDNDGLTDAYEQLVSHTGTNTWDTDGDEG